MSKAIRIVVIILCVMLFSAFLQSGSIPGMVLSAAAAVFTLPSAIYEKLYEGKKPKAKKGFLQIKSISLVLSLILLLSALVLPGFTKDKSGDIFGIFSAEEFSDSESSILNTASGDSIPIPEYKGLPYAELKDNRPDFQESDYTATAYEKYSPLDSLGRCGVCIACIGTETMPTQERGSISKIKPSGWHTVKYDNIDGKYLYNRCHLIGYQLTAENANSKNLITGTRYLNVKGMLPFENMVADYIKETGNHVLYRVTPHFGENNLLAYGVQIEAYSVEDGGDGICFNVYCYNVQPGIYIDYKTGSSLETDEE